MKETQKIYAQIVKNVHNKKWICMFLGCSEISINSHLLQQNGILKSLAVNGHLIEVRMVDVFKRKQEQPILEFKKLGITSAISFPLYCNNHDTKIFKKIETERIDFSEYDTPLLFSYRALCSELRKKEIQIETFTRLKNSQTLNGLIDEGYIETYLAGLNLGVKDLVFYKNEFERDIMSESENFLFKVYKYNKVIDVYRSATFSPIDNNTNPNQIEPFNTVFVHIIPNRNDMYIIIGHHKLYFSAWISNFIQSWSKLEDVQLEIKISELFAARIETWGMSPNLYGQLKQENINKYLKYMHKNASNLDEDQTIDFNLFER